ncbi:hypothetical protein llap_6311 [Limosa lapponica baueri]|uniref:Uncharacterized protein n=1 Tax=Limosa lapponica baueri TaxID=1758121 RepID=A0A2I0UBH8_LIMLA|nr:hypothetical protein llap_6311 [Limosa lapponica baueri]
MVEELNSQWTLPIQSKKLCLNNNMSVILPARADLMMPNNMGPTVSPVYRKEGGIPLASTSFTPVSRLCPEPIPSSEEIMLSVFNTPLQANVIFPKSPVEPGYTMQRHDAENRNGEPSTSKMSLEKLEKLLRYARIAHYPRPSLANFIHKEREQCFTLAREEMEPRAEHVNNLFNHKYGM